MLKLTRTLKDPQVWLLLYLVMVLTGAGSDYAILKAAMVEQTIFVLAVATAFASHIQAPKSPNNSWLWLALAGCAFLLAPLFSSIANDHRLSIILTSKFRQLIKIMVAILLLFQQFSTEGCKLLVQRCALALTASTLALATAVLIRFFALGEVHPETGRMDLAMRHGNANYVAAYLGALAVLCGVGLTTDVKSRQWLKAFAVAATIAVAVVAVFASTSRMGIIALVVGVLTATLLESRRLKTVQPILFSVVALLCLIMFGWLVGAFDRFQQVVDPSSLGRVQGIKAGLILFSNSPFFGAGFDQTPNHIYHLTRFPLFREFAAPAVSLHNAWFQTLSEMGIFGMAALVGFWTWTIYQLSRLEAGIARSLLCGSLVVVFLNQQTLPVAYNDVFITLYLLPGLLAFGLVRSGYLSPR